MCVEGCEGTVEMSHESTGSGKGGGCTPFPSYTPFPPSTVGPLRTSLQTPGHVFIVSHLYLLVEGNLALTVGIKTCLSSVAHRNLRVCSPWVVRLLAWLFSECVWFSHSQRKLHGQRLWMEMRRVGGTRTPVCEAGTRC